MSLRAQAVCLAIAIAVFPAAAVAQSIFTIAGGGSDDGLLATEIHAQGPQGLAFGPDGNLYYGERFSGRVRMVDMRTNRVTTIAGNGASGFSGDGGPATSATLKQPRSIVLDGAGNVYIADFDNGRIRRVDAQTKIITTLVEANGPWGLAIHDGWLYFTESGFLGNRIQRVNLTTKAVERIAGAADGEPGFSGDGGKATDAKLAGPLGLAIDAQGNVYVADAENGRVRRIDANGVITTYAGGGSPADGFGDGGRATDAKLDFPTMLTFDLNQNLVIGAGGRIRRVDRATGNISSIARDFSLIYGLAFDAAGNIFAEDENYGTISRLDARTGERTTFIGGGTYVGDGQVGPAAILREPLGLALDSAGNLYIADASNTLVRKLDTRGVITTVAGKVGQFYAEEQEGIDARDAVIGGVLDVAVDSHDNLYIASPHNEKVWRVDKATGKIFTHASGVFPIALALDGDDNLYIADPNADRIRRVDAKTKEMTFVAGNGTEGFSGDGGPANDAALHDPHGVAVDGEGNLFIADSANGAIRKVDPRSRIISTYAGRGEAADDIGDGGPATAAEMLPQHIAVDADGNLFVADGNVHRVRRIDAQSRVITTVAGSATFYLQGDFAGDNGPARQAKLNFGFNLSGLAIDTRGNVYLSDTDNNRVRAVYACAAVEAPQLLAPLGNDTPLSPRLRWSESSGAFRYDVYLDTVNPPRRIVGEEVDDATFAVSNLQPSTRYYWMVVAKGDPFCDPRVSATSSVGSFTTTGTCALASFDTVAPANEATNVATPVTLTWQPVGGAASYDLYLGPASPPALFAGGITGTSFTANVTGRNFWLVVARAACSDAVTSSTPLRSFTTTQSSCTPGGLSVTTSSPATGATNVASSVELRWNTSGTATSYDVYFGTSNNPPPLATAVTATRYSVTGLEAGTTYFWRVVAKNDCDTATSATASFTTASCASPEAPVIVFAPATVSSGATYTIVWTPANGLDADGGYLVERSTSANFGAITDAQVTRTTSASFLATTSGTFHHRVRAIPSCDPSRTGPNSAARSVNVTDARPNVVFSVQPAAAITSLGERLEDRRGSFTLENLGTRPLQVIVGRQELAGSPPFFSIVDPRGNDAAFVTLEPRTPRTFEIRYAGPRNDVAESYEGVIFVAATGDPLTVTPYAFVNLKVGGGTTVAPQFLVDDVPLDYAAFAPFPASGDDRTRPPLTVTIRNPGTTPMELAAEIGPEVWLVPESGWNDTALPPGASRNVRLTTLRSRAPNGSPLPRYTYFTVRSRNGASARLLVQDNDTIATASGRANRLELNARSLIVPEVVSRIGRGPVVSRLWLTNVGGDAVQAELIFTRQDGDGFDANAVRRATVIIPPNDVVTLTDPLVQIFALGRPARGQLEIVVPRDRAGVIGIQAAIVALSGGTSITIPVVARGDGARAGAPQTILGITRNASVTTALTLAETTGIDSASVTARILNASGETISTVTRTVPRYGHVRVDELLATNAENARVEVSVAGGSGASIVALATVTDPFGERGAVSLGTGVADAPTATSLFARTIDPSNELGISKVTVVPVVGSSSPTAPKTGLTFVAPSGASSVFRAVFRNGSGTIAAPERSITLSAGGSATYKDVLAELFGLAGALSGSISVDATNGGKIHAVLQTATAVPASTLPLPSSTSDATTGSGSAQRPLFHDGLDQSTDPTRGKRWTLLLNEVGGGSGRVRVMLYESGNRTRPLADKEYEIAPNAQVTLDTIFASLGLDIPERRKDRTNVQLVVLGMTGSARTAATAVSVDAASGDTKAFALVPGGAVVPTITKVTPVAPPTSTTPGRRRAVGPR